MRSMIFLRLTLAVLLVVSVACKPDEAPETTGTTAETITMPSTTMASTQSGSIDTLKVGKDKDVTTEADSFGKTETIYAVATVKDADKGRVIARLAVDDVPGQTKGPIPGLEASVDLSAGTTANFNFSAPTAGWPSGKYNIEVSLLNEAGEQKDQENASFSVP